MALLLRPSLTVLLGLVLVVFTRTTVTTDNAHILTQEDLLAGLQVGRKYVEDLDRLEEKIVRDGRNNVAQEGYTSARFKSHPSDAAVAQSRQAAVQLVAREHLSEKFNIPPERINFDEVEPVDTDRQFGVTCGTDPLSVNFRTADGTCNNPANPLFGQAETIFQYLLGPFYKDGISKPRPGPSARSVSLGVAVNESIANPRATLMTMQFGQFLDHDLTQTPPFRTGPNIPGWGSSNIDCCMPTGPPVFDKDGRGTAFGKQFISFSPHPECFPITLPPNDPIYSPNDCMNFVRSAFGMHLNGSTPFSRRQINSNTHWLDASQIYGSSAKVAESLRDKSSGLGQLATSISPSDRVLLPTDGSGPSSFVAGDSRVNGQPMLTMMHTLFLREHNRVANLIFDANPGESDDWYYKQARRFVVAKWQHIVYKEYLPVLLGPTLSAKADVPRGTFPPGNPAIFSEFSTAAFRMGHSQLKSFIRLFNRRGGLSKDSYFFADSIGSGAKMLSPDFMDSALRGLIKTPVQQVDNAFPDDLTSQLFKLPGNTRGFDLLSLSVQRGRDHGVYPYVYYRLPVTTSGRFEDYKTHMVLPSNFEDLKTTTPLEVIDALRNTYKSVLDVDLYVGGVTELPVPGGLVGPTFGNIIAKQFQNLKQSDNFFYDRPAVNPFTTDELNAIKKTSLARIICDNSDGSIRKIQPNVFLSPDEPGNKQVPCVDIPIADFF